MKSKINIPKSFFSFLIASFFIWLLINLSKEYVTTIRYQLIYEKLPQNKVFQEEPLKEMDIQVKATGFKLLSANFSAKELIFNLGKIRNVSINKYYILPKAQELKIQEQLYKGLRLEKILRDTIYLNLGSLESKKVPVKASLSMNFEHGYDLASPIKIIPDSVLISGPKLQLEKINSIATQKLTLDNISVDIEKSLSIEIPKEYPKVVLKEKKIKIKVKVDKFTEGEFLVPFIVENLPDGIRINTFPKKVKVVFKVGLNNFNKITPNSFKVVCNYKTSKENQLPYLIPKLKIKSSLISSIRIIPSKIEYLTQK